MTREYYIKNTKELDEFYGTDSLSEIDTINEIFDDFESRNCGNCRYFNIDETIDPNMHFGFCNTLDAPVDGIVTIDFGCNKFLRKDDENNE